MKIEFSGSRFLITTIILFSMNTVAALAADSEVRITHDKSYTIVHEGDKLVKISRIQDNSHTISGSFAKTSRPCPPFCINPMTIDEGVKTVAELEVIKFIETSLYHGDGLLVDARTPGWYKKGTIPGSVNIPFTTFDRDVNDPELIAALENLGAVQRENVNPILRFVEKFGLLGGDEKTERWDFSDAKELLLWCNGPWCGQSPRAIRGLLKAGYPAHKLSYYRGGMQSWQSLGLTTILPEETSVASNDD